MYKGGNNFMEIENSDVLVIFLITDMLEVSLTFTNSAGI